ncbi:MAG: hypothetical protein AVDCRST_MAG56-7935 [uncultured Cytophagales bacterium]|uniref:Uncharacterized protein n=1 Tax=uncultured Cytophagales bacterium TaxID=158755 RepID=A0A6J4LU76_9SPHI|nr:MAG: hypothetical protein AVDCRST_MAG56-7935 [uncultured Cytophagales bacterium]
MNRPAVSDCKNIHAVNAGIRSQSNIKWNSGKQLKLKALLFNE